MIELPPFSMVILSYIMSVTFI